MTNTHRIKIKLGDAEFEAEGAPDTVQSQYEQFLAALERTAPKAETKTKIGANETASKLSGGSPDEALLARIFELRQDGVITLRTLPKGEDREADAFLLILYGYRRLKGEEGILGTHLLLAAKHSGISTYRPAYALAAYDRYVIRGGQRKGSMYSLNNQGVVKAEEIAAKIFE